MHLLPMLPKRVAARFSPPSPHHPPRGSALGDLAEQSDCGATLDHPPAGEHSARSCFSDEPAQGFQM